MDISAVNSLSIGVPVAAVTFLNTTVPQLVEEKELPLAPFTVIVRILEATEVAILYPCLSPEDFLTGFQDKFPEPSVSM